MASSTISHHPKRVLLLGSGFVAAPAAEYVSRRGNHITVASRSLSSSQSLASFLPQSLSSYLSFDISTASPASLDALLFPFDLVISLLPPAFHPSVIESAIRTKTHVVTTSYVSKAMQDLDKQAREAGVVVFNEIGVDPGVDHLWAVKTIKEVHAEGGKILSFTSHCGAIPAPECADNPLGYRFAWSPRSSLLAMFNDAAYLQDRGVVRVEGKDLMSTARPHTINNQVFVAFPNRDSLPFTQFYDIPEAHSVSRWTMRYPGFPGMLIAWKEMGFFSLEKLTKVKGEGEMSWADLTRLTIGAPNSSEAAIFSTLSLLPSFSASPTSSDLFARMRALSLFCPLTPVKPLQSTLFDTLCAHLEQRLSYTEGTRDRIVLEHRFGVERKDGKRETLLSTLEAFGTSSSEPDGTYTSAMARLVGVPCGIAVQLVLDGVLKKTGVQRPYDEETCALFREILKTEGIDMVESVAP